MAFYDGETLKKKIDRGAIPIDEVISIISQIAQGLSRAQENGIIHRDIKPANIFITNRNDSGSSRRSSRSLRSTTTSPSAQPGRPRRIPRTTQVNSGGSFGANPLRQTIGLGKAHKVEELQVYWPSSGTKQVFQDVSANRQYRIEENSARPDDVTSQNLQ